MEDMSYIYWCEGVALLSCYYSSIMEYSVHEVCSLMTIDKIEPCHHRWHESVLLHQLRTTYDSTIQIHKKETLTFRPYLSTLHIYAIYLELPGIVPVGVGHCELCRRINSIGVIIQRRSFFHLYT